MRTRHTSRYQIRATRLVFSIAIAVAWVVGSASLEAQDWTNPVETARQFLLQVYPELTGHEEALMVINSGPLFLREAWTGPRNLEVRLSDRGNPASDTTTELLGARFSVPPAEPLSSFSAAGSLVHTAQLERLREEANAHPEWSDSRLIALLRNAGANALPDQVSDPRAAFQAKAITLAPFIGVMTWEFVEFRLRDADAYIDNPSDPRDDTRHPARLEWRIHVRAGLSGKTMYLLDYEPFEGRLVRIYVPVIESFADGQTTQRKRRP